MIYRILLKWIKRLDNSYKYCFSYWWTRIYYFLDHFNPISPPLLSRPVNSLNLHFSNPVGLAAGFDRNGSLLKNINSSGFGFIEVGTININSEIESDKNINSIIRNLEQSKYNLIDRPLIGVSLGSLKNKIDQYTVNDYIKGMDLFWNLSDYIVINLSRPGSAMRSEENKKKELHIILDWIKREHIILCKRFGTNVPIIIKVAIEYKRRKSLPETLVMACELDFDGLLIAFENWPSTTEVISTLNEIVLLTDNLPLIVVGGIKTENDAIKILNAGAKLVQCHSLLVEQGPIEMKKMIRKLILIEK
jgi:dihydroorotate dehydrogenase